MGAARLSDLRTPRSLWALVALFTLAGCNFPNGSSGPTEVTIPESDSTPPTVELLVRLVERLHKG
jgi:hypothetical protein